MGQEGGGTQEPRQGQLGGGRGVGGQGQGGGTGLGSLGHASRTSRPLPVSLHAAGLLVFGQI